MDILKRDNHTHWSLIYGIYVGALRISLPNFNRVLRVLSSEEVLSHTQITH